MIWYLLLAFASGFLSAVLIAHRDLKKLKCAQHNNETAFQHLFGHYANLKESQQRMGKGLAELGGMIVRTTPASSELAPAPDKRNGSE